MNQANESKSKNVAPWKILEDFVHLTTIYFIILKITFLLLKFLTLDYSFKLSGVLNNDKLVCMTIFFTTNIKGVHIYL